MARNTDYYYKGYDIDNKNRLERYKMEYLNPFGYNLSSSARRIRDYDLLASQVNQDLVKNKEINLKH